MGDIKAPTVTSFLHPWNIYTIQFGFQRTRIIQHRWVPCLVMLKCPRHRRERAPMFIFVLVHHCLVMCFRMRACQSVLSAIVQTLKSPSYMFHLIAATMLMYHHYVEPHPQREVAASALERAAIPKMCHSLIWSPFFFLAGSTNVLTAG